MKEGGGRGGAGGNEGGTEGKKIHREGRKSVEAVERRGGRRWEYVCGCFILLRGCGWRLVGGGGGGGGGGPRLIQSTRE